MKPSSSNKSIRNVLVFLLVYLGVGALYGGALFIISPNGEMLDMPVSALKGSPFHTFLIPGIVLFTVLGITPLIIAYALVRPFECRVGDWLNFFSDMQWAWAFSVYIGIAVVIWIQVQMIVLNTIHWAHSLYVLIGLLIVFVTLLPSIRQQYLKQ